MANVLIPAHAWISFPPKCDPPTPKCSLGWCGACVRAVLGVATNACFMSVVVAGFWLSRCVGTQERSWNHRNEVRKFKSRV